MTRNWRRMGICIGLVVLMVFAGVSSLADEVTPRYTYADTITAGLTISAGRATASGTVVADNMMATKLIVQLQQNIDGEWRTIGSWSASNSEGPSAVQGSEEIDQGFEYRAYAFGFVYDSNGNILEAVSMYSPTKYY